MNDDFLTPEERTAMGEAGGYLSRNRMYLARQQRERRARMVRIDYMPSDMAQAIIEARRGDEYPLNTNSGIIDAIVIEWARKAGTKYRHLSFPAPRHESGRTLEFSDTSTRARMSPSMQVVFKAPARPAKPLPKPLCGARRHRDGQPCQARPEPGKKRCRFHGGRSTGPRSAEGKARALANLKQNRNFVGP